MYNYELPPQDDPLQAMLRATQVAARRRAAPREAIGPFYAAPRCAPPASLRRRRACEAAAECCGNARRGFAAAACWRYGTREVRNCCRGFAAAGAQYAQYASRGEMPWEMRAACPLPIRALTEIPWGMRAACPLPIRALTEMLWEMRAACPLPMRALTTARQRTYARRVCVGGVAGRQRGVGGGGSRQRLRARRPASASQRKHLCSFVGPYIDSCGSERGAAARQ